MNSTDKVWLVKCKGHILGPFDSMSVEKMVKEGEISIEDSLCIPHKIWRKVSDYQNFQKVVKEIKGRRNEDYTPKTSFDDSQTQTIDQDLRREDTVTQEINPKNINANRASEIVLENVVEEPIKRKKIPNTKPNTNRSYGYQATQVGQKEASEFKKVIWRSSIILLIIFLGAYVYKTIYIDPEDNKMLIVKYRAEAVSKGRSGQYTEALKLYEKILEVDPKDFEAMLRLGIYYIQVDDQVFKGQELLRKVIANGGPFPKYAYVGIGLGYHAEKELSEAENYYLKSLELDGRFAPALVNLGSIELERGNYKKARGKN